MRDIFLKCSPSQDLTLSTEQEMSNSCTKKEKEEERVL